MVGAMAAFFGVGAITAGVAPMPTAERALRIGGLLLLAGLGLPVGAEAARSLPLLISATVACGVAMAYGYRGSLQSVNEMAPRDRILRGALHGKATERPEAAHR